MKLKYFFIALVAMVACFSEAFAQQVITVSNAEELKQALKEAAAAPQARQAAPGAAPTYSGQKIQLTEYSDATKIDQTLSVFDNKLVLDLNGYVVYGNMTIEEGQLSIIDNKGTGAWIGCITVNANATLAVGSGNVIAGESGVAVVNAGTLAIDGGAIIGKITNTGSITGVATYNTALVANTTVAQAALNAAIDGQVIQFASNIEGDLTAVQKPSTKITIDGASKTLKGTITVDGKSAAYATAGVTIKNLNFDATAITKDASINLGVSGNNNTRYTNNVTIENCTFTDTDTDYSAVVVKSYTGGDKNLVIKGCTATGMHSLAQLANVEEGLVIEGCTANTKNGINLGSSAGVQITKNTINVKGYGVRIGASSGGESGTITITENTLKTDNTEGDAVVVLRGTAPAQVDLSMTKNVVSGTTHISGTTSSTKISAEANYWDGKEQPVVAEGSTPVVVNSYYTDAARTTLERNEMGSVNAFVSADRITGDVTHNAVESLVIQILDAKDNIIGTSTLENDKYRDGTKRSLTWRINLGADDSDSWAMNWKTGAPSIDNMPAKVKVLVDGVEVGENTIKLTQNGDGQNPVFAAKTEANGKILSFLVSSGFDFSKAAATLVSAAAEDDNIVILEEGTYTVPTGKNNLTITGKADGVVKFDNIGARNMGGASVTFYNVTFTYANNSTYKGLQHSGNLVYNNCTINGQVFLYGQSETFNNCTFENPSSNYNVWTYSAKEVTFNNCTFNCAGKSVLIYAEDAGIFNNVTVTGCTFKASQAVEGKAAIEMDSSLTGGANVTITNSNASGFGTGNVSGNSLWNNKKGNGNNANNDITVTVDGKPALAPVYNAKIGETGHRTLQEAINAVKKGETIALVNDVTENVTVSQVEGVSFVIDGQGMKFDGTIIVDGNSRNPAAETLTIQNVNFETSTASRYFIDANDASPDNRYSHNVTIKDCNFTAAEGSAAVHTAVAARFRQAFNIKIEGGVFTNMHSVLQAYGVTGVEVSGVKTVNNKNGVSFGTSTNAALKNVEFADCVGYGVRVDAAVNTTLTIENAKIKAFIPVVAREATGNYNVIFNGTENTMEATNADGIWCAIGTTEYETNGTLPTAATGKVKVALNDTGLNAEGVYGDFIAVAAIGEEEYDNLQKAINAVKNGETITLVSDIADDVTISQTEGVKFTLDGDAKTYTGTITVDGKSAAYSTAGVTIKNVKFDATANSKDVCINLGNGNTNTRYVSNVTVDNCEFTDNDKTAVGVKSYTGGDKNLVITGCTATGMHSLLQVKNVENVTIKGCTIEGSKNGVSFGASSNVVVESSTMACEGYGVRVDASVSTTLTVTDANISAFIPVVAREATGNYNVAFNGANTMNATNDDDIWCAIGTSEYEETGKLPTPATGKVNVALNDPDLKIEGVYGNAGVASIGRVNYPTFAAALDAVQDGETITLAEGAEGNETKTEIEFDKDITFTITGKAPKYSLPVITFQNATVNIKDAHILIPELDARQNATINVIDSKVDDAGGNSIAKSYYNGAINIDKTSTVHMMQVTTMGYINIAGTLNATWQTNVYGNGMITMTEGATFNTAALHLTGKDYSGRDNTDADRVGKPATIVVDGANFTVGKVIANNGSDYSYNSKKGINIGTVDGKQAVLDIKNGANVNIFMANGETANIGAGATVNVASSTLKTICRDENGTVTLANNGAVYVTGNSQLDVKKYSGNAIKIENANLTDSYFAGRIDAFGVNNLTGTTVIGGILGLGYETNPTEQVVVNITGNFTGANVLVRTNNGVDNLLNVGKADAERTTVHFGQLGAFADVNVANADVTYGYAFIRNDFNATNSTFEIKGGVNTYFSGNAKVVLDNSTWSLPGYANIGSYGGYMYGNADVTLKNGSSMTATNLGIEVSGENVVKLTLEDTSSLTATALKNQGSIVLASVDATLISNEVDNVTTSVADHKVAYAEGSYKVVAKNYVASIEEDKFESLAAALNAATAGQTITLVGDVTEDVTVSKAVTIDGAGKTYTGKMTLKADATLKNVNFDGKGYNGYAVETRGAQYLTIEDCTAKNYGYGFVQLASATALTTVKNVTVTNMNYGVKVDYSNAVVLENVDITAGVAAVLNSNYGEKTITVKNSTLNILGTWKRNDTTKTTYVFEGANTVGKFITEDALDNFKLAAGATLTAPEGKTVTTDVENSVVVYETGAYKVIPAAAKIGEQGYATLQEAINAVQNGQEVVLLKDCAENVTLTEKVGLYYTIDGAGKTMKGTFTSKALSDTNDNRRITIKNIKFVDDSDANVDFISSAETNHYPRLTVEGCTFTGSGNNGDVAIRLKSSHSVVIKDCTGTGLHSFLQNTSGWNLTVENVTVTDSKSGLALGTVQGVIVKGSNIVVPGYGIRLDANTYNNNAVIESNTVKAFIPVVVRNVNTESNITFNGTNTMTATNTDGIWCAIGKTEYEENGKLPEVATGKVKVALNDTGLKIEGVYGNAGVASIGRVNYPTFAAALAAAQAGDKITLVSDVTENVTTDKKVTIDGAGKTYTGAMTIKADITIKNVNFDGKGYNGYAVETRGANYLTIEDCTAKNYGYGFVQLASGTALTTVKNVTVTEMNYGVKVDYSGAVVLENVDITAGVAAVLNSNYGEKTITVKNSKLNILGTWTRNNTIKTTYVFEGANTVDKFITDDAIDNFKLAADATLTAPGGKTVTTDVENSVVVYKDGVYQVKGAVAQIGTQKYAALAAALNAATAGQTITLVGDVTEDVTVSKAVTIDGAGKTYTGAMTIKADITIKNVNFDGKGYNGYAVETRGANYLTIEDCTAKNYGYGFVQLASGTAQTTVKDVTVSNMNYGVKVDYSNAVVLENVDITAAVAAVLNSNYGEKTITIKDSKLSILGTWTRNNTIKTNYVFEGENTVGTFVIDSAIDNFYLAVDATLTAPNDITMTTDRYYEVKYDDDKYFVEAITVELVDGQMTEFINANDIDVKTLTYTRTFQERMLGKWQTLYVPFEIPVSELNAMGYEVAYFNDFRETLDEYGQVVANGTVLEMIIIRHGVLKANFPYAIKPKTEESLEMSLVLNDVKLYSTTGKRESVECSSAFKRFTFDGTYKTATKSEIVGNDDVPFYAMNVNGIMQAMGPDPKLGAFRVYMTITKKNGEPFIQTPGQAALAREIPLHVIGEEDENGATIIYDVVEDNLNGNDFIYDLQGRRVSEPKKGGIYIKNGKKILY